MRSIVLAAIAAFTLASVVNATPARDPKTGRFIKSPPPAAAAATNHCRNKTTKKFAKCSAPNTEPVPVKKAA